MTGDGGANANDARAVSAGGVVYRRGPRGIEIVLCGREREGLWALPKGTPKDGEALEHTALREVREETGLVCEIVPTAGTHAFATPHQLPAPYTILLEDIPDRDSAGSAGEREPAHQHIDLIYFVRPVDGADHGTVDDPTMRWVTAAELRENAPLDVAGCGVSAALAEDLQELALAAIAWVDGSA